VIVPLKKREQRKRGEAKPEAQLYPLQLNILAWAVAQEFNLYHHAIMEEVKKESPWIPWSSQSVIEDRLVKSDRKAISSSLHSLIGRGLIFRMSAPGKDKKTTHIALTTLGREQGYHFLLYGMTPRAFADQHDVMYSIRELSSIIDNIKEANIWLCENRDGALFDPSNQDDWDFVFANTIEWQFPPNTTSVAIHARRIHRAVGMDFAQKILDWLDSGTLPPNPPLIKGSEHNKIVYSRAIPLFVYEVEDAGKKYRFLRVNYAKMREYTRND
jgi:hypothetical protein